MLEKLKNLKFYFIFLFLGIIVFFSKFVSSGFDLLPGDNIDSRYLNYIFEHFWLWLHQVETHTNLWDLSCLYPAKNTLAYSDLLFGLGMFYVPTRLILNEYNSFVITIIIACILNFSTFYYLLKKCFNFKDLSCSIGAYFFAFSIIRYAQMCHIQLLSQFYTILALICFIKSKNNNYLSFVGCIFFAIQLYTSFYQGWFVIFSLFLLTLILLFFKNERENIFNYIKQNFKYILVNVCFLGIILLPLIIHYLMVGVTKFPYYAIQQLTPPLKNYFINNHFVYSLIFSKISDYNVDLYFGIGLFTLIFVIIGLIKLKKYRIQFIIFILSIMLIINTPFLIKLVYNYFPAGGAIRTIGRYVNILIPVFGFVLANLIENLNKNSIKTLIILLFIIEQIPAQSLFIYSKKEAIRDVAKYDVPKTCSVIFLNYSKIPPDNYNLIDKIEIDGVWVALKYNIYTVNGYPLLVNRKTIPLKPECILELKD